MQRSHRATSLGTGLLVGAGALVAVAFVVDERPPRPTTSVEPVVVAQIPATIPTTPADGERGVDPPPQAAPPTPAAPLPISPIVAQLPDRVSAVPDVAPARAPVLLGVPDIGLMVPVRDIGVEADGQLEIPDETEVGWYRLGSSPGRGGSDGAGGSRVVERHDRAILPSRRPETWRRDPARPR